MSFTSWIASLNQGLGRGGRMHLRKRHAKTLTRQRSFLPRLEMLEDRTLLSTFNVLNLGDAGPGSLRQAIVDANNHSGADVIRFAPRLTGTIALTSQLSVTDDLRIDGPGANRLTISGGGTTRVFDISGGETDVLIDDLTIADGMATGTTVVGPPTYVEGFLVVLGGSATLGGGILNIGASVTLDHVSLVNNQANAVALAGVNAGGGGIANVFGATLTVAHSSFTGNQALGGTGDSYGGAIFNDAGSTLTVKGCTFTGNQATEGAYLGSFGGAIANTGGSQAMVSDSSFKNNVARGGDGADGAPISLALTQATAQAAASPV